MVLQFGPLGGTPGTETKSSRDYEPSAGIPPAHGKYEAQKNMRKDTTGTESAESGTQTLRDKHHFFDGHVARKEEVRGPEA